MNSKITFIALAALAVLFGAQTASAQFLPQTNFAQQPILLTPTTFFIPPAPITDPNSFFRNSFAGGGLGFLHTSGARVFLHGFNIKNIASIAHQINFSSSSFAPQPNINPFFYANNPYYGNSYFPYYDDRGNDFFDDTPFSSGRSGNGRF